LGFLFRELVEHLISNFMGIFIVVNERSMYFTKFDLANVFAR